MELQLVSDNQSDLNQEALDEFIEHRQEMKKPMTRLAIKKATNILKKHPHAHQQYMVDRAILSGWTGLWEVEPQKESTTRQNTLEQDLNDTSWAD